MNSSNGIRKRRPWWLAVLVGLVAVAAIVGTWLYRARGRSPASRPSAPPGGSIASARPARHPAPTPSKAQAPTSPSGRPPLFAPLPAPLRHDLEARGDGRCKRGGEITRALVSRSMNNFGFYAVAVRGGRILLAGDASRGEYPTEKHTEFILLTSQNGHLDWGYRLLGTLDAFGLATSGPVVAVGHGNRALVAFDWQGHERWRVSPPVVCS